MSSYARKKYASRIDADAEQILSLDFYQHKVIMQAIQSPFKSLESGTFQDGLTSVILTGYLLEKFAESAGILKEDEIPKYKEYLDKEKEKNLRDGFKPDDKLFKVRMAYAKIAYILKIIEFGRAKTTQYKV